MIFQGKIRAKKAASAAILNLKTKDDFGQIVTDSDPDDSGSGTSNIPLTSETIVSHSLLLGTSFNLIIFYKGF